MSSFVPETGFAQGASGPDQPYDTSPSGLGLSPAYLAPGASASASAGVGTIGTTFPTTPADATQFTFIADSTLGIKWTFLYRSASASSYKWEFVGGAALRSVVSTNESTASAANADLATVQSITIPLAGDYMVRWGCDLYPTGGTASLANAITKAGVEQIAINYAGAVVNNQLSVAKEWPLTGLAVADVLKSQFRTTANTGNFLSRFLYVEPVRVSG